MSCHVMSCHVLSCHVMSCHVMSCHVISRLLTSCHVLSCHLTSSHVLSYHIMSCHVMSCHVMSRLVMSCHVMSSHVFSRLVTSCHIMSSCSRILLPNLSSEPSKFFYYGGGVAPTRFSKPWPCAGIRLGATLSLWRRAHCERARVVPCTFLRPGHRFAWQAAGIGRVGGVSRACWGAVPWGLGSGRVVYTHGQRAFRVAGSGDRACCEHAGRYVAGVALCRGDSVPGVFCTRMANVRFAWQAAGIVRSGSVPGGARGPCRRRRAVGIGFGARRARAHDFARCDLRFAWQVWDFGCIDALGKALNGGSAWQAQ